MYIVIYMYYSRMLCHFLVFCAYVRIIRYYTIKRSFVTALISQNMAWNGNALICVNII